MIAPVMNPVCLLIVHMKPTLKVTMELEYLVVSIDATTSSR